MGFQRDFWKELFMSKDPAFLMYSSDFITGVQFMNMEQRGKYITLLCLQHQQGHIQKKHMLSICSAQDEEVLSKFVIDDKGMYYNIRLEEETIKRRKYSESRRNNALNGEKSNKKNKSKTDEAYAEHMENENEDVNINNKIEEFFEKAWSAYPKKKGKSSIKKTKKIELYKVGDELFRAIERYANETKGREWDFVKNGDTFFRTSYIDYLDANYCNAFGDLKTDEEKTKNRERISAEIKKQELEDKRKIDEKYSGDANLSPKLKKIFEEVDV